MAHPVPRLLPYHQVDDPRTRSEPVVTDAQAVVLEGRGKLLPAGTDGPARVTLGDAELTIEVGADSRLANYRDLSTIAVQSGSVLLVLGSGEGAERLLLTQFGPAQGALV